MEKFPFSFPFLSSEYMEIGLLGSITHPSNVKLIFMFYDLDAINQEKTNALCKASWFGNDISIMDKRFHLYNQKRKENVYTYKWVTLSRTWYILKKRF